MLQAFRISEDGIEHRGRMIETPKYLAETAAGRALYSTFGTNVPSARGITDADALDARGRVQRTGTIPVSPMSMPHDFAVTAKHIVIMIPPFWYEPEQAPSKSFLHSHRWHGDAATRVLVIDKNDLGQYKTYELPAQWVFHFGNGWEGRKGVIRDARLTGVRNDRLFMLTTSPDHPTPHGGLSAVSCYGRRSEQLDTFNYPISQMPEEHLFVPAPRSKPERRGWVVGTAYDYTNDRSLLNVFSADRLADGPLCTATLPYGLPLGLHGKFVT